MKHTLMVRRLSAVSMMAAACLSFGGQAQAQGISAGVGAAEIKTSPEMLPVEGYTSQHDPISSRVLLLDEGGLRVGILVVDTPSISDPFIESWKAILTRAAGVKPENALVIASHDTSAPHVSLATGGGGPGAGPNAKAYAQAVDASIETAAAKALSTLQPVQLGFGVGTSRINTYRNVSTPKGWALGYDDAGFTDPSLGLVRINTLDGMPLAWLMNYAVRPAILENSLNDKGGKAISGDLVGASERYLEAHAGPGVAIFLMGAGVDQSPYLMANRFVQDKNGNTSRVDIHEAGFNLVDLLGERLGSEAARVSEGISASAAPATLRIVRQSVDVKTQVPVQAAGAPGIGGPPPSGAAQVPFVLIRMGDIAFVGVTPELNADIGVKIRAASPFAHTIVVTMVDGSAKYLPDVTNYDRKTPEALGSRFARGSAETVAARIIGALKKLK